MLKTLGTSHDQYSSGFKTFVYTFKYDFLEGPQVCYSLALLNKSFIYIVLLFSGSSINK